MKSLCLLLLTELCFGQSASIMAASGRASVLTYHNDNFRTGLNTNEAFLSPANVNSNTFGKLFERSVTGSMYPQPLIIEGLNIGGGSLNVVFLATAANNV